MEFLINMKYPYETMLMVENKKNELNKTNRSCYFANSYYSKNIEFLDES